MNKYEELIKALNFNNDKTMNHDFYLSGRLFPFPTRNPERVKFIDSFDEIIGIIARISQSKSAKLLDIKDEYLSMLFKNLESDIEEDEIATLFDVDLINNNNPYLIQYYSVKASLESEKSELKGKVLLANFMLNLFDLKNNNDWLDIIEKPVESSIFDSLIVKSLPVIEQGKEDKGKFVYIRDEMRKKAFQHDLSELTKDTTIFKKYIGLLLSYYLFNYLVQLVYKISTDDNEVFKSWYSFDTEAISMGRNAAREGYGIINDLTKELLVNVAVLNYLNAMVDTDRYLTYSDFLNEVKYQTEIDDRLFQFNRQFALKNKLDHPNNKRFEIQLENLRDNVKQTVNAATSSRYRKFFDEVSRLTFIKQRGRLGYIFNATQDLLIMFVTLIIGDKEKMLIRDLFNELEVRGLFFDQASRREIIEYFDKINILEKLSDSGDAQYVRTIL